MSIVLVLNRIDPCDVAWLGRSMAGEPHQAPVSMAQPEEEDTPARRPLSLECPPRYQDYLHIAAFESGGSHFSYGAIYPVQEKFLACKSPGEKKDLFLRIFLFLRLKNKVGVYLRFYR